MTVTSKDLRDWKKYELTRLSGQYNMITDMERAANDAGLSTTRYCQMIKRYSVIKDVVIRDYGSVEEFMNAK